jgi:hypothetical protein
MEHQHKHLYKKLFGIGAVLLCLMLLLPSLRTLPVGAQTQPPVDTNREEFEPRIQAFFITLSRIGSASAFEELLRGSPLDAPEARVPLTDLRRSVDNLQAEFGEILNWERLEIRQIGAHIAVARFALLYEHYPVVWTFTFYRRPPASPLGITAPTSNPNPWVLIELHFEMDMKNLP